MLNFIWLKLKVMSEVVLTSATRPNSRLSCIKALTKHSPKKYVNAGALRTITNCFKREIKKRPLRDAYIKLQARIIKDLVRTTNRLLGGVARFHIEILFIHAEAFPLNYCVNIS